MERYLIVIDMQNDFIDGTLGTKEAQAIVPDVRQCVENALKAGRTVLFTQDTHPEDYLETAEGRSLPIPHCIRGTEGWRISPALADLAETVLEKPTFASLRLAGLLDEKATSGGRNLDIELCGVCTDICVVSNALLLKTHFPEAAIRVLSACTAGTTPENHQAALAVMRACQIGIS